MEFKRWFDILCDYSEVYPNNRAPPETPILTQFHRSANILMYNSEMCIRKSFAAF